MKPQGLFRCCVTALLLLASATAVAQTARIERADVQAITDASARDVAALIAQPGFATAVTGALATRPDGVPLARVMARFDPQARTQASRTLAAQDRQLRQQKGCPPRARTCCNCAPTSPLVPG